MGKQKLLKIAYRASDIYNFSFIYWRADSGFRRSKDFNSLPEWSTVNKLFFEDKLEPVFPIHRKRIYKSSIIPIIHLLSKCKPRFDKSGILKNISFKSLKNLDNVRHLYIKKEEIDYTSFQTKKLLEG